MSHTITVMQNGSTIAEMRFTASDRTIAAYVYKCLDAEEFDGGISGFGESKKYSLEDIEIARKALEYFKDEPFEEVRNKEKDELEELLVKDILSQLFGPVEVVKTDNHRNEEESRRFAVEYVAQFLDEILKKAQSQQEIIILFS